MRLIVLANPGSLRWEHFSREVERFNAAASSGRRIDLHLVPWREVVPQCGNLDGVDLPDGPALVRLESPGMDAEVTEMLLAAGSEPDAVASAGGFRRRYRGWRRVLEGLAQSFADRPHWKPLNDPLAVAEMFDKNATSRRLRAARLPVPDWFEPPIGGRWPAVAAEITSRGWRTAYVKVATGSSSIGIVAVDMVAPNGPRGFSTLSHDEDRFVDLVPPHVVEGERLAADVDRLLAEGATVQRGVPKARIDGQPFDLRVVVVDGRPEFSLFRLGDHAFTSLQLGGRRGDAEWCRRRIPPRQWLDAMHDCATVGELFGSFVVGVDVAFEQGTLDHAILEVNAFGDFFPNWTDAHGRTIPGHELDAMATGWLTTT